MRTTMIEQSELIERWANVERVLEAMPEHERRRHWDMSTWGKRTECGTVACAAGHCGLDPWFRDRGFHLDLNASDAEISSVDDFFGTEGSWNIFRETASRPVETVIEEVRAYVRDLRRMAELTALAPCRIGDVWPTQGGVFAGARLGRDGSPDYYLIAGPEYDGRLSWREANEWAAQLEVESHRDLALPYRAEQRALFDRVRSLFQLDWYWSCEQPESSSSLAWFQSFSNGDQDGWDELSKLRARLVRRIYI